MRKKAHTITTVVCVAMLPFLRYLGANNRTLLIVLSCLVIAYFLLWGIFDQLLDSKDGRKFLRRIPSKRILAAVEKRERDLENERKSKCHH